MLLSFLDYLLLEMLSEMITKVEAFGEIKDAC